MIVYDTINADQVEVGDLVLINDEQMQVIDVIDSGDVIMIKGESWESGDNETHILAADAEVYLWTE